MKLAFYFSQAEKDGILTVLDKYPTAPNHHSAVRACIELDGTTVLFRNDAIYLAGIIVHYYLPISARILAHPGIYGAGMVAER